MINAFKLDSIYFWFRPWLGPYEFSKLICEIYHEFFGETNHHEQTSTLWPGLRSSSTVCPKFPILRGTAWDLWLNPSRSEKRLDCSTYTYIGREDEKTYHQYLVVLNVWRRTFEEIEEFEGTKKFLPTPMGKRRDGIYVCMCVSMYLRVSTLYRFCISHAYIQCISSQPDSQLDESSRFTAKI